MNNGNKINIILCLVILVLCGVICVMLYKGNVQVEQPTPTPIYATATPNGDPTPTPDAHMTPDPTAVPTDVPSGTPTSAPTATPTARPTYVPDDTTDLTDVDLSNLRVNEAGDLPIVMWHQFSEADSPNYSTGTRQYMNSFDYLYDLCERLYNAGFRLVSMEDYLNNNITIPAGTKPIIFTFDDGVSSQFSLIEVNGKLELNPKCAVYVMQKFAEKYPDFGFTGIIYVNLGQGVFDGAGTVAQRLNYLIDLGWEIGNHTYNHTSLKNLSADQIKYQLGKNQEAMESYVPGYKLKSLALPYGEYDSAMAEVILSGTYNGVSYENKAVFLVGAEPAHMTTSVNHKSFVPRIRSTGYYEERMDFEWWLANQPESYWTVSDGDPNTITCPANWAKYVTTNLPNGQVLRTY